MQVHLLERRAVNRGLGLAEAWNSSFARSFPVRLSAEPSIRRSISASVRCTWWCLLFVRMRARSVADAMRRDRVPVIVPRSWSCA